MMRTKCVHGRGVFPRPSVALGSLWTRRRPARQRDGPRNLSAESARAATSEASRLSLRRRATPLAPCAVWCKELAAGRAGKRACKDLAAGRAGKRACPLRERELGGAERAALGKRRGQPVVLRDRARAPGRARRRALSKGIREPSAHGRPFLCVCVCVCVSHAAGARNRRRVHAVARRRGFGRRRVRTATGCGGVGVRAAAVFGGGGVRAAAGTTS